MSPRTSDAGQTRDWPDTVHLGQYDRVTANAIAGRLEKAGIFWWYKEPGYLSQIWEFGVRLFVEKARLRDAQEIARQVSDRMEAKRQDAAREARRPRTAPPDQMEQPGQPDLPPPPDTPQEN